MRTKHAQHPVPSDGSRWQRCQRQVLRVTLLLLVMLPLLACMPFGAVVGMASQSSSQLPPGVAAGAGFWAITGGQTFPIVQDFGQTPFAMAHVAYYAYGQAYGMPPGSHPGVDIGTPYGTPLYSPITGVVTIDGGSCCFFDVRHGAYVPGSGELMIEEANGDQLILGHMSEITVQLEQPVAPGTPVGFSGDDNGNHVHVEWRVSGTRIVDPRGPLSNAVPQTQLDGGRVARADVDASVVVSSARRRRVAISPHVRVA